MLLVLSCRVATPSFRAYLTCLKKLLTFLVGLSETKFLERLNLAIHLFVCPSIVFYPTLILRTKINILVPVLLQS